MPEETGQRLKRTGDQETDEILGEIEREGAPVDQDEDEPDSSVKDDQQADEEDAGSEADKSDEDSAGDESDEGGEDSENLEPARRTSESTLSEREAGREAFYRRQNEKLLAQIAELTKKQSVAELNEKLKVIAEKEGMPLDRLTTIAEVISESVTSKLMSPEQRTKIDRAFEYAQRETESERQDALFDTEFRETVLPLLKNTEEDPNEVYRGLYAELFSDKPENQFDPETGRPRRSMVQAYVDGVPRPVRRSGESSRIRSGGNAGDKPITQASAEEIADMSDEEFDRKSDEAALNQPRLVQPNRRTL